MKERAFADVATALGQGELVCIFPEGRLSPTGSLQPFQHGIERIVAETPVPVVPVALAGLWGSIFSRANDAARTSWRSTFVDVCARVRIARRGRRRDMCVARAARAIAGGGGLRWNPV